MTESQHNWTSCLLKEVLHVCRGGVWGEDAKAPNALVLRTTNIKDNHALVLTDPVARHIPERHLLTFRLLEGDIVMTKSNSIDRVGSCGYFEQPESDQNSYVPANFCQLLRVNKSIVVAKYVYYWLCSQRIQHLIRSLASGTSSSLQNINGAKIESLPIDFPLIGEQRRIVERIDECMERLNEIHSLRRSSLSEIKSLPGSLIESELGTFAEVSGAWRTCSLGDLVVSVRNGRSISQDTEGLANGSVLTITAVRDVSLGVDFKKPIQLTESILGQFTIEEGDVFVSRANTIDLVGLAAVAISKPAGRLIYPDLLIRLRVDTAQIRPRYLTYALRGAKARKQIKDRALGSSRTMVKISGERLREVQVAVPSLAEQDKIIERLDAAQDLARILTAELKANGFEYLRASILHRAFAGEL